MDTSETGLLSRVEKNLNRFIMELGAAGGGEQRDDAKMTFTVGGSPIDYHNAVVASHLSADQADDEIDAFVARLEALQVPGSWHVTDLMEPADLPGRLVGKGFVHGGDEVAMALDLTGWSPGTGPESLSVTQVVDDDALDLWRITLGRGFGAGPHEADWVAGVYRVLGLAQEGPWLHFLGTIDGKPVATMTMLVADSVAGFYFVFTDAHYRNRGIASRLLEQGLLRAQSMGCDLAVLAASSMGASVYERLGFRGCGQVSIFEYAPG